MGTLEPAVHCARAAPSRFVGNLWRPAADAAGSGRNCACARPGLAFLYGARGRGGISVGSGRVLPGLEVRCCIFESDCRIALNYTGTFTQRRYPEKMKRLLIGLFVLSMAARSQTIRLTTVAT